MNSTGRRVVGVLSLLVLLCTVGWILAPPWLKSRASIIRRDVAVGPVAAESSTGEAVVATLLEHDGLTSSGRRRTRTERFVELQLNRFADVADLGRYQLYRTRSLGTLNLYIVGVEQDRIWIWIDRLLAFSISQRRVELDAAALEERVPALRGRLPGDRKFYEFDAERGLQFTSRDGEQLLLNTQDWSVAPAPTPAPKPQAASLDEYRRQMNDYNRRLEESLSSTLGFRAGEYGMDSWVQNGRWLGLLSEAQQQKYSREWTHPRRQAVTEPVRRRLLVAETSAAADGAVKLGEMRPLTDRTYLRGGILRAGKPLQPVQPRGTPDLIIEHYSSVDEAAQMLLTRITPAGEERWTATLPIRFPRQVLAGDEHVVLAGLPPGTDLAHRQQLVSVNLSDGAVATYSYNVW